MSPTFQINLEELFQSIRMLICAIRIDPSNKQLEIDEWFDLKNWGPRYGLPNDSTHLPENTVPRWFIIQIACYRVRDQFFDLRELRVPYDLSSITTFPAILNDNRFTLIEKQKLIPFARALCRGNTLSGALLCNLELPDCGEEFCLELEEILKMERPSFDGRTIRYRGVKHNYVGKAETQCTILWAFENEGWPTRIQRPENIDLRNALRNLKVTLRELSQPPLPFQIESDGDGYLSWKPL